jgi:hypothetical protein
MLPTIEEGPGRLRLTSVADGVILGRGLANPLGGRSAWHRNNRPGPGKHPGSDPEQEGFPNGFTGRSSHFNKGSVASFSLEASNV